MSQEAKVEGWVDGLDGYVVTGWAMRSGGDGPAIVEARVRGEVRGRVRANHYRGDVAAAGKGDGYCGFQLPVAGLEVAGPATVTFYADGIPLGSSLDLSVDLVLAAKAEPAMLPRRMHSAGGVDGRIERLDETGIMGWAVDPRTPGCATFTIVADGNVVGRITASEWRSDVAEFRQGDGRAGFDQSLPAELFDGRLHIIDLQIDENGPSVLAGAPFVVKLPASHQVRSESVPTPVRRKRLISRGVDLSFVVVFYNMRREAERTLTSLSRAYQRDIDDVEYEVICVDNGSKEPLDAAWIESFGPEFRLYRPEPARPSPVFAMNEAARMARGKRLALMIDGAHIVTPGVIREALAAFREMPDAVVGLRQWFIGGDQRWLSQVGYTRPKEDIVFGRIGWPRDGYRLFEVSTSMMPSANSWFDSASESNCLMLTASLFRKLGGYDEAFDLPGGGVANLDLYTRAVDIGGATPVMLVGEASFHQFHGGTTTNIEEAAKDAEVRRYRHAFSKMRGYPLHHIEASRMRFVGHMPTPEAAVGRQRPMFRGAVGVTPRIKSADAFQYLDEGALEYLNGYAIEAGVPEITCWSGKPTGLAAGDLVNLQEIIGAIRPAVVIAVNASEGLAGFLASILHLHCNAGAELVWVSPDAKPQPPVSGVSVTPVVGRAVDADVLRQALDRTAHADDVLVVFRPDADDDLPIASLQSWLGLVSPGSYLVFAGVAEGQPYLGYSTRWRRKAIQLLTGPGTEFRVDPSWERHLVTACPWGYLRRIRQQDHDDWRYDASLDDLSGL